MDKIQPVLSICIPTYNRCKHVVSLVEKILSVQNKYIEVIVSDNASNDNTVEELKEIQDKRFVLIGQIQNIGSFENGFTVMQAAKGKYLVLLTDKDSIDITYLDTIINTLSKENISVGCFAPNYSEQRVKFKKITSIIKKIGAYCFSSNHPSIFFYNREILESKNIISQLKTSDDTMKTMIADFISALMCQYGEFVIYHIPFINLELPPFEDVKHSHTYSLAKNNVYFLPQNRFKMFEYYVRFLSNLKLNKIEKFTIICLLSKKLLRASTDYYLDILSNEDICDWYGISEEFQKIEREKDLAKDFVKRFRNSNVLGCSFKNFLLNIYLRPTMCNLRRL